MEGRTQLAKLHQSVMNIHKLALSHIVATDYGTMITLVNDIKEEEKNLDDMLAKYEIYITDDDRETYDALLSDYDSLKHSLVFLVCASASGKTQDAYSFRIVCTKYRCREARASSSYLGLWLLDDCDLGRGGSCCDAARCRTFYWIVFRQQRSGADGGRIYAGICVGLDSRRNSFLFQRLLLRLWVVWDIFCSQFHFYSLRPDSTFLSGIQIFCGYPFSYGSSFYGRIWSFSSDLCRSFHLDEQAFSGNRAETNKRYGKKNDSGIEKMRI